MGTHHFADGRLALGQRVSAGNLQAQLIYQAYGRMPPTPETKKVIWPKKDPKTVFGIFGVLAPRDCEKRQQVGDLSVCTSILSFGNLILKIFEICMA